MNKVNYGVYIGVGNGVDIGIDEDNNLVASISHPSDKTISISFGLATESTFKNIISYLERLKIHAV